MWRKIWRISSLKYIAAFLIPLIFVMLMNQALDNDSWYVLAEGREIANNGIYYEDTLSMHEGLSVTVQNYGFAVIFYYIFEMFGAPGIYAGMLILNFEICFLLYKICVLISNKNVNLSLLLMMLTDLLLALGFVVTRAQMVSYVIFLLLIYILELYVKTDKTKYLWWIPLLSVLQINLHASLWWMLILVELTYIIDAIKKPKLHLQGYRMKPLIVVTILTFLCGLLNPYGIKMITFIFTSYGNTRFNNMIVELSHFSPFSSVFSAFVYLAIVVVLLLYIFGKRKNIRVRYLLMLFGFLALGLNTVKGLSQFVLTLFFPLACLYKDAKLERIVDAKKGRDVLVFWTGVITLLIFVAVLPVSLSLINNYPNETLVEAVDVIDKDVAEKGNSEPKVYANYNDGGYVEYRGYKPYLDPRGEVFLERNNKKEDILYEWDDFMKGKISIAKLLAKYEFDYVLVSGEDDPFKELESNDYELLYENDDNVTKVYGRVANE